MLRLQVKAIDLSEGLLDVHGKGWRGGQWEQIPLHWPVQSELKLAIAGTRSKDRVPRGVVEKLSKVPPT